MPASAATARRAATSATTAETSSTRPTSSTHARRSTGSPPLFRETKHLFLDLPAFADRLREWISANEHWRPNVRNFSLDLVGRPEAATDHARPRLGRPDPGAGLRGGRRQADLRLVRRGDRLPLGERSSGPRQAGTQTPGATGGRTRTRATTTSWARTTSSSTRSSGRASCWATARAASSAPGAATSSCLYDVVASEFLTMEGRQFAASRGVVIYVRDFLERLRPGRASLLPDRRRAGDAGHGLHLVGVRPPQQRRARRHLGEPRQPDAHDRAPELRLGARARARSAEDDRRCSPRFDGGFDDGRRADRGRAASVRRSARRCELAARCEPVPRTTRRRGRS